MTARADIQRLRRRRFASPGSGHDRVVGTLQVLLPGLAGALVAFMALAPLTPRGEISFLLDKNRVDIAANRVQVTEAMYRGEDDRGRPFSLKAGSAVQRTARTPVVEMADLTARMRLESSAGVLTAPRADYDMREETVAVRGPVRFATDDGYRLVTRDVDVDLDAQRLASRGRVTGSVPAGTFSADRIRADLSARTVTLDGRARLRMEPGRMRMP